ncbi:MAG TPA: ARMT1-like domain-containing protein, partial [Dissulfurispiraceae bacterium]|nr:ARMT1-like domain-containing protein [Dissulfurispiraceae bacterium]
ATDMSKPPAYSTTFMHRKIRQLLGKDPFKDIKSEYNQAALRLYPALRERVFQSSDPLRTASRLAIAGNIIDFGIFSHVDITGTVERALSGPIAVDHYSRFKCAVDSHPRVFYLLDNSGEIVFDRLLIEVLMKMGKKVTAVVKGSPVLNDSTASDAAETGLTEICEVVDNGSDCIGTILEMTSPDFKLMFADADFIISKGQGNFETLGCRENNTGIGKEIVFLLQAKCDVVSKELGLSRGSMLLLSSEP